MSVILLFMMAVLAPGAQVQEPRGRGDFIDSTRRLEKVAAQKTEADVRLALREGERLAAADPAKAKARLEAALARLEEDTTLAPDRRDALKRMFKDRLRILNMGETAKGSEQTEKQVQAAILKLGQDRDKAEREKMVQKLKQVAELRQAGKTEAADRLAAELAAQHPEEPAVSASERTQAVSEQVAANRELRKEKEKRFVDSFRDIDRAALPPKGDIEYPKNWHEKDKRTATVKLTAKERAIMQALRRPISVRFKDSKFDDVIEYLQTIMGQPIIVDTQALKDADASYDTPVSLNVKGVSARTVLRRVLADLGLTYVIKDEVIQVTSIQRAREMMVVRAYYVGDLVLDPNLFSGWQALRTLQNIDALLDLIRSTVEPSSWQDAGGTGTIRFDPGTLSIVIKQSAEVHAMMGGGRSVDK